VCSTSSELDPAVSKRVIISGHSQGGHAALWAASLAPSYTPELRLLGTAAFAPQSHTAAEASFLKAVNLASLTPLAALILRGVEIADPSLHVGSLLTKAAAKLYPQTLSTCLNALSSKKSFGGLPLTQLVSRSANLTATIAEIAKNDPDHLKIKAPVLLEQGLADKTVLPALDRQLSQSLAAAGDTVTYTAYPGATHGSVLRVAAKDATAFLRRRFGR
jgi:dienelactone hydrolase